MDLSTLTQSLEIGLTSLTSKNYDLYLAKLSEFNSLNAEVAKFDKDLKPDVLSFLLQLITVCLGEISLGDESSTQSQLLYASTNCIRLLTRDGTTTEMIQTSNMKTIALLAGLFYQELPFCQPMKTGYSPSPSVQTNTWIEGTKSLVNIIYVNYKAPDISNVLACIQKLGVLEHLLQRLSVWLGDGTTLPVDVVMYDLKLLFLITACSSSERVRVLQDTNGFYTLCSLTHKWLHFSFRAQTPVITKKHLTTETTKDVDSAQLEEVVPFTPSLLFDALCAPGLPEDKVVALIVDSLKILFSLTANWTAEFYSKPCNKECLRLLYNDLRLVAVSFCDYSHSGTSQSRLFNDCVNLLMNIPYSLIPVLIPKLPTSVLPPRCRELTAPPCTPDLLGKGKVQSPLLLVPYEGRNLSLVKLLIDKLDESLIQNETKQDELTLTKITLLPTLRTLARGNPTVRHCLRKRVLPPLKQVTTRPEEGGDIRARITKLMTHTDYSLAQSTADFLFVLCKENVDRMVKYSGFGNAAGLLMQRGLLGGGRHEGEADYSSDSQDSDTDEFIQCQEKLNPITGAPKTDEASPLDSMTEEEKEREAADLMEKIERLNKTGVIQMIGPSGEVVQPNIDPSKK